MQASLSAKLSCLLRFEAWLARALVRERTGHALQAWRRVTATCGAVRQAEQQARQAHLEDIAATFHILFRRHSIMQAWHSAAQRTKHERVQLQQQEDEQRDEVAKGAAASRLHALYVKHSAWQQWVELAQQGRAGRELAQQHQARQHSIHRFVQVTCTAEVTCSR